MPNNFEALSFFLVCILKKIKINLKEIFTIDHWSIGFMNSSITNFIKTPKSQSVNWILKNSKKSYWADPFVLKKGSEEYIFFEEFNYNKKKGHICAGVLKNNKIKQVTKNVLNLSCHTSYPYILKVDNTVFCIPETSSLNKVLLFKEEKIPNNMCKSFDIFSKVLRANRINQERIKIK